MKHILIIAALTAGLVAVTGCKKASEKITEKLIEQSIEKDGGGKASVDIQEGKMTIKDADGTLEVASGDGAKIPAEFPKDVFLVKNAKVVMSMKSSDGMQVMLETKESVDEVAKLYAAGMKAQEWEEETNVNMGDSVMCAYKKGEREATVIITKGSTGAQVQIVAKAQ